MNIRSNPEIVVELQKLTKQFDTTIALDAVDLTVKKGECLVLAGPSGAGKTTLLRMIAGLELADKGVVVLEGAKANELGAWERSVGMTFENYALYPHLSVFENIAFPLRSKFRPSSDADVKGRVGEIANMLGIGELLQRKTDQLSGGQRQRVSLARCLVREAAVYLLDEPLAHLDAKLRLSMRAEFKRMVSRLDATIIYVTHDYREALALGDRIAIIQDGRIVQLGTQDDIFERPSTLFVAQFIGNPPMNILEGFVENGVVRIGEAGNGELITLGPVAIANGVDFETGPVLIGIRPMDCFVDGTESGGITGTVKSVKIQQDGSESVLVERGTELIEASLATGSHPSFGAKVSVNLDTERALIFDKKTQQRIGDISAANRRSH